MDFLRRATDFFSRSFTPRTRNELRQAVDDLILHNDTSHGPIQDWDVSNITDMSHLFDFTDLADTEFNEILAGINAWNTSNVTNMSYMFHNATHFNQPIHNWNTSRVTDMSHMFHGAKAFNTPLYWNVRNVTDMSYMFYGATNFNQSLSGWNTSNVTNMSYMFCNAQSFNGYLYNWDTSNVTDMSHMFNGASEFNRDIYHFNTSRVEDMSYMFSKTRRFNQNIDTHGEKWDVSNVINFQGMFEHAFSFRASLRNWRPIRGMYFAYMFRVTSFDSDISEWAMYMNPLADTRRMFERCSISNANNPLIHLQRRRAIAERQRETERQLRETAEREEAQRVLDTERRRTFLEQQRQLREQPTPTMTQTSSNQFPECCICLSPLNNIDGPAEEGSNDNDVIRVCDINAKHFMHRGCARQWANPPTVDVVGQMGITEWGPADRQQRRANTCPTCTRPITENLEEAPKVEEEEILRESAKGGKRRRRRTTRKTNKKKKLTKRKRR